MERSAKSIFPPWSVTLSILIFGPGVPISAVAGAGGALLCLARLFPLLENVREVDRAVGSHEHPGVEVGQGNAFDVDVSRIDCHVHSREGERIPLEKIFGGDLVD